MNSNWKQTIWHERWSLAALSKSELIKIALAAMVVGLAFVIFHFQGNTADTGTFGRSVLRWVASMWGHSDAESSHGPFIPIVSLVVVWLRRRELMAAPKKTSRIGLALFIVALMLHYMGAKGQQTRISLFALVLMTWAVPFYLFGWQVAKILIFPCAYLIFAIPLNFLDTLTFPLRMLMTRMTTGFLNGLGLESVRSGSAIRCAAGGGFDFDVADPCSGLRSLLAMTAITAVYAYFTLDKLWKQWFLFMCSIPIAIIGNLTRIVTIALVAGSFGERVATGIYHDYSTYIFFPMAITLMITVGSLLQMNHREELHEWKLKLLSPIS